MKTINWRAIDGSEVWNEDVVGWLKELRSDALEDMARSKDTDEYRYWQGYCMALAKVLEMPQEMIEAERRITEQENTDNGRRDNNRRDAIARIRRTLHIGGS